jgi:deoxyribonuclease NucA/NucB
VSYPVLIIDWELYHELADNIWHAQMAGHPSTLTYNGPYLGRQNRKEAMHLELDGVREEILHILSRDEYPFACTVEGGKASWVGHIPPSQNSAQGGLIAAFLRRNGIIPCIGKTARPEDKEKARFKVEATNHPRGQVVVRQSGPRKRA